MTFKTIHTAYGLAKIAAAEVSGVPINLTQMAVGDGNGNPTTPSESQTALVREMFRATVNRVYQDSSNPLLFTAELLIPATEGGFVIRECGIFDSDGALFAVANIPDTYKPVDTEGAFSDTVIRLQFMVGNASVITLIIDPAVAVATHSWVIGNVTPAFLLPGGTTAQVLTKDSNADGDFSWHDPNIADVVVDVIEEKQTLAAAQTVVTLVSTTTRGAAIYIEGIRLRNEAGTEGWQPDVTLPDTKVVLGKAYPAGTIILIVQNEPLGSVPFPLARDLNLSDVPSKLTARTNLDVYSKGETDQKAPASVVSWFARNTAPAGWLKANGAAVSRAAYSGLFAAIGTTFGVGDGFNTFGLPDLRGEFVRGWDDSRGIDSGRPFGSSQLDALQGHYHESGYNTAKQYTAGGVAGDFLAMTPDNISGSGVLNPKTDGSSGTPRTATETRPRSVALLACIKF